VTILADLEKRLDRVRTWFGDSSFTRYQPFQALERRLQQVAQVLGVGPHGLLRLGIGGLLPRLQDHPGGMGSIGV